MHLLNNILLFLVFSSTLSFAEDQLTAKRLIKSQAENIQRAATAFKIDSPTLKAIIFSERTLNVDWFDKALDVPTALKGYNSSIGFCQVKLKTAYWIEVQLADSTSEFYPGKQTQDILPISKSPREIIKKLQNDSLNILYAAAYVNIIQSYWQRAGYPIADKPDILGTLYSTGLYNAKGEIRKPNANPKANSFGRFALKAYSLFFGKIRLK